MLTLERQCATTGLGDPSTVTPPTSSPHTWPERQGKASGLVRRQTGSAPAHTCRLWAIDSPYPGRVNLDR